MHVLKSNKEQLTLKFGKTTLNGQAYNHSGMDYVKKSYSLDYIVACQKGKVIAVRNSVKGVDRSKDYGNYVKLEHGNGYTTIYAHMKQNTIKVKVGDVVNAGTVLGYMGDSGYTFGAHLHFELRKNNTAINPQDYMNDKKTIPAYTPKEETGNNYIVTASIGLNCRTGRGTSYKKVKAYKYKTKLKITEIKDGWGKTKDGWVCMDYVKKC